MTDLSILDAEQLRGAFESALKVLSGGGLDKHGHGKWKTKVREYHLDKFLGHMIQAGRDPECGEPHAANALIRLAMVLQIHLDTAETGPALTLDDLYRWRAMIDGAIGETEETATTQAEPWEIDLDYHVRKGVVGGAKLCAALAIETPDGWIGSVFGETGPFVDTLDEAKAWADAKLAELGVEIVE